MADTVHVSPQEETFFTDLPGVEGFDGLSAEQQAAVTARANRARCDCGCFGHSVSACLHQKEACDIASRLAAQFVADASLGEALVRGETGGDGGAGEGGAGAGPGAGADEPPEEAAKATPPAMAGDEAPPATAPPAAAEESATTSAGTSGPPAPVPVAPASGASAPPAIPESEPPRPASAPSREPPRTP